MAVNDCPITNEFDDHLPQRLYCSAPQNPEDILWEGSDTEETTTEIAAKHKRYECHAQRYLLGHVPVLQSASLRGPLNQGWLNPWRLPNTSKRSERLWNIPLREIPMIQSVSTNRTQVSLYETPSIFQTSTITLYPANPSFNDLSPSSQITHGKRELEDRELGQPGAISPNKPIKRGAKSISLKGPRSTKRARITRPDPSSPTPVYNKQGHRRKKESIIELHLPGRAESLPRSESRVINNEGHTSRSIKPSSQTTRESSRRISPRTAPGSEGLLSSLISQKYHGNERKPNDGSFVSEVAPASRDLEEFRYRKRKLSKRASNEEHDDDNAQNLPIESRISHEDENVISHLSQSSKENVQSQSEQQNSKVESGSFTSNSSSKRSSIESVDAETQLLHNLSTSQLPDLSTETGSDVELKKSTYDESDHGFGSSPESTRLVTLLDPADDSNSIPQHTTEDHYTEDGLPELSRNKTPERINLPLQNPDTRETSGSPASSFSYTASLPSKGNIYGGDNIEDIATSYLSPENVPSDTADIYRPESPLNTTLCQPQSPWVATHSQEPPSNTHHSQEEIQVNSHLEPTLERNQLDVIKQANNPYSQLQADPHNLERPSTPNSGIRPFSDFMSPTALPSREMALSEYEGLPNTQMLVNAATKNPWNDDLRGTGHRKSMKRVSFGPDPTDSSNAIHLEDPSSKPAPGSPPPENPRVVLTEDIFNDGTTSINSFSNHFTAINRTSRRSAGQSETSGKETMDEPNSMGLIPLISIGTNLTGFNRHSRTSPYTSDVPFYSSPAIDAMAEAFVLADYQGFAKSLNLEPGIDFTRRSRDAYGEDVSNQSIPALIVSDVDSSPLRKYGGAQGGLAYGLEDDIEDVFSHAEGILEEWSVELELKKAKTSSHSGHKPEKADTKRTLFGS